VCLNVPSNRMYSPNNLSFDILFCFSLSNIIFPFYYHLRNTGRTNRRLFLIRHGQNWKRRVQKFFFCWVCIRYRGNVSTEPLPSKDRGIFTEPLLSNDKAIFTEPLPSNDRGGYTDTHTQIATWSHKPTLFFQNECRLRIKNMKTPISHSSNRHIQK
jgi:hypothetical protein